MIQWETGRSTETRHEHVTRRQPDGRDVCLGCGQVVFNPIISSEDPRLATAGFHRSGGKQEEEHDPFPMPLPQMLIALYEQDYDFPVAPYLLSVMQEYENRNQIPSWITPSS